MTLRRPICALPERHTDDAGDQTDDQQPARRGEQQFDFAVQLRSQPPIEPTSVLARGQKPGNIQPKPASKLSRLGSLGRHQPRVAPRPAATSPSAPGNWPRRDAAAHSLPRELMAAFCVAVSFLGRPSQASNMTFLMCCFASPNTFGSPFSPSEVNVVGKCWAGPERVGR